MAEPHQRVTVADIDVPFFRLVAFFVKATLAAIPAAIIVWLLIALFWFILAGIFGPGFWWHRTW